MKYKDINKGSIDAIRPAILELEKSGYITRTQGRDEKGKMIAITYTIYEYLINAKCLDCIKIDHISV